MDSWIALLGRRDHPTDALKDYCTYLGQALAKRGIHLHLVRVPWAEDGWVRALHWLWREARAWRGHWVLMQYTALQWSRRGFPFGLLAVLGVLKRRGCRVGVVYHDAAGFPGHRPIDRVRRRIQHGVMRRAYRWADRVVSPVPPEALVWLPAVDRRKISVIPVGPNVPERTDDRRPGTAEKVVAVFCVTGRPHTSQEVADIAFAVRYASEHLFDTGRMVRLVVFGRGAPEAESDLRRALDGTDVSTEVLGLLPAEEVAETLSRADALLFVRGPISGRRGSAIAGIACGLPVVAYAGPETGFPITEAGVRLVPYGDRVRLAEALTEVLADEDVWQGLHRRSREAQARYFSWDAIAGQMWGILTDGKA